MKKLSILKRAINALNKRPDVDMSSVELATEILKDTVYSYSYSAKLAKLDYINKRLYKRNRALLQLTETISTLAPRIAKVKDIIVLKRSNRRLVFRSIYCPIAVIVDKILMETPNVSMSSNALVQRIRDDKSQESNDFFQSDFFRNALGVSDIMYYIQKNHSRFNKDVVHYFVGPDDSVLHYCYRYQTDVSKSVPEQDVTMMSSVQETGFFEEVKTKIVSFFKSIRNIF